MNRFTYTFVLLSERAAVGKVQKKQNVRPVLTLNNSGCEASEVFDFPLKMKARDDE